MSEDYTAGAIAALSAGVYHEQVFVKIEFPGLTVLLSDMDRNEVVDGETYIGSGDLGDISQIVESADMVDDPISMTLSGLDTNLVSELKDFTHQGSRVTIKVVLYDANDQQIPDPITIFTGIVDTMGWTIDDVLIIEVTVDHFLRMMFRGPDGRRRMQGDQEAVFPGVGDLGYEFATRLTDQVPWGIPTKTGTGTGPMTGGGVVGAAARRMSGGG